MRLIKMVRPLLLRVLMAHIGKFRLQHPHGPENAEHELRKAYNSAIENGVIHFWDRRAIHGVHSDEVFSLYKRAMEAYRQGNRLVAERWARTTKHLARAFWHEAKIAYLEPRMRELPCMQGGQPEEFNCPQRSDTPEDLLNSSRRLIEDEGDPLLETMAVYQSQARKHLDSLRNPKENDLLHFERAEAAYEYARVVECMSLALEAERSARTAA
jgi:hypothetical protein